ncbi:MAG: hypothetical protein HY288_05125 [Planctomycetia bacterium]|nr:hypothetical protein [Planctomycetia bacterium]
MSGDDENDGLRWPHLRWEWLLTGLLLIGFQVWNLPEAIHVVQTPNRWHGFEVTWNRKFIYATPVVILAGAWMVRRAFLPKRSFQFSIVEMLIAMALIAALCGIAAL